jgi:hypothetical protein
MKNELFTEILDALTASLKPYTPDENTFVHEVAQIACKAAQSHFSEVLEANEHLNRTVREMSKRDNGATVS